MTCTFVAAIDGNAGTRRRADVNGHGTLLRDVGWSQPHMWRECTAIVPLTAGVDEWARDRRQNGLRL